MSRMQRLLLVASIFNLKKGAYNVDFSNDTYI